MTKTKTIAAMLDSHPSAHILTETLTRAVHALTTATEALQAAGKPIPPGGRTLLTDLCTIGDAWDAVCQTPLTTEQASAPTPAAVLAITITPNDKGNPPGKLADAELHFMTGPLSGTRLIGFAVWERRGGSGRNVTFPARQYSVNGERRSFALLRPSDAPLGARMDDSQARIRDLVLDAFTLHQDSGRGQDGAPTRWPYTDDGHRMATLDDQHRPESSTPPAAQASTTTTEQPLTPYGLAPQDQPQVPTVEAMAADLMNPHPSGITLATEDGSRPMRATPIPGNSAHNTLAQAAQVITTRPDLDPGTVLASALVQGTKAHQDARQADQDRAGLALGKAINQSAADAASKVLTDAMRRFDF